MTRKIFSSDNGSLSILDSDGYSAFSVVGYPAAFYVYIRDSHPLYSSRWINGNAKLYHELRKLHTNRQKEAFVTLIHETMLQYTKSN